MSNYCQNLTFLCQTLYICLILKKIYTFYVMLCHRSEPPKDIERLTLLKSIHIFKKHRVQYEMRTHYRCFEVMGLEL